MEPNGKQREKMSSVSPQTTSCSVILEHATIETFVEWKAFSTCASACEAHRVKNIFWWKFGKLNLHKNRDAVRMWNERTTRRNQNTQIQLMMTSRHSDWRDNEKGMKISDEIETVRQQLRCRPCHLFLIRHGGEGQTADSTVHNSY